MGDAAILGYEEKYLVGADGMESAGRELPASIPSITRDKIAEYVVVLTNAMDLTGAPRFDFLWDGNESVKLCEVNAIPGAWGNYLWRESGVTPTKLYRDLLSEADAEAATLHQWIGSTDGRALRVSKKIASKLI